MKISVVIPAYNCGELLLDSVESCLRQTRTPEEIIIVEDRSTDGTLEVARRAAAMSPIVRVIEMGCNQEGLSAARNAGALSAIGDLLVFLDDDDKLDPSALQKVETVMEHEESEWCACGVAWVWPNRTAVYEQQKPQPDWRMRLMYDASTIRRAPFIKKSALIDVGMFDQQMVPWEDWECWVRLTRVARN